MKKILIRIGVLLLVFISGVAVSSILMNGEMSSDATDLSDASFPEVMVEISGTYVNRMYGYAEKMQVDFTRDSLTPMDTSKSITLVVDPYGCDLYDLSYEIRTSTIIPGSSSAPG